ncbi:FdhE protein [Silvimonas terrae]|uniref:FdhE protein n=1 Tax=Silvimonas terrae TaxID=300266 RepID=A0A840RD85_9NEIS|nr:formate dehydrogenase accessory protein FdhE [Silvimonas terrae]MBB5190937.1 FdhE protein [Silvimonas terrae]
MNDLILPATLPYGRRATRLNTLASGHELEGYLNFCSALCRAQQVQAEVFLPEAQQSLIWQNGAPCHDPQAVLQGRWPAVLKGLLKQMVDPVTPWQSTVMRLQQMSAAQVQTCAQQILTLQWHELDRGAAPFVAAALQVDFLLRAQASTAPALTNHTQAHCPVCGFLPVGAILHDQRRYLHCALCESEWHHIRAQCVECNSGRDMGLWSLQEGARMVAETCGDCHGWLKQLDQDAQHDLMADDLATLELDAALSEQGFERISPNLLLFPGAF